VVDQSHRKNKRLDAVTDRLGSGVAGALDTVPNPAAVKSMLQGKWLGLPLHPALTSVPLGAWTSAAVFDLVSIASSKPNSAATANISIGVVGALGAAASGLMDWHDISDQRPRRLATAHSMLNSIALLFDLVSLSGRLRGHPSRWSAFIGFLIANASAYLGGELVFGHDVEVMEDSHSPSTD
jgi:uncharacterized membrane protein